MIERMTAAEQALTKAQARLVETEAAVRERQEAKCRAVKRVTATK